MNVIQYHSVGKSIDLTKNEDIIRITDDFLFLGDGATSSTPFQGRPGGIVAGERVGEVVTNLPPESDAYTFVERATIHLQDLAAVWDGTHRYRACVQALVYSRIRREIWRIGDCHFAINGKVYLGSKNIDSLANQMRKACLTNLILQGTYTEEELMMEDMLLMQRPWRNIPEYIQGHFQNLATDTPMSYGTLDGTTVPDRHIEIYPVPEGSRVVFCTDGFPTPPESFEQGLRELSKLKALDPLLIKKFVNNRPFQKNRDIYDDTSGIWFTT